MAVLVYAAYALWAGAIVAGGWRWGFLRGLVFAFVAGTVFTFMHRPTEMLGALFAGLVADGFAIVISEIMHRLAGRSGKC